MRIRFRSSLSGSTTINFLRALSSLRDLLLALHKATLNVIGKKLILPEGLVVERNVRLFSSPNPTEIKDKLIKAGSTISNPKKK